jgi:RimJ/RimL family protein N-acetyltransferase
MSWLPENITLTGENVTLLPLEREHFDELIALAADTRIWEFYPYDASRPENFRAIYESSLSEKEKGTQFPFVIKHNRKNKLIGSTRFLDIQLRHRKLEIGATWLIPCYWGSIINPECKLLLLSYCFEQLNAVRVQLKTDERNLRSRKAIANIGGHFEGILRNDMIRDDGTFRNSAYFSIISEEWPVKKENLKRLADSFSKTV